MAKDSKRVAAIREKIDKTTQYAIDEGLFLLKELSTAKFDETVDASINLGVDPRKSEQNVRGSSVLPNGTGKVVRVAVFTQGDNVDKANEAGADIVGMQELADSMKGGDLSYDVVIASPDAMGVVGQLGSDTRASWFDAQSESRNCVARRGYRSEKCKSGAGSLQN